MDNYIFKYYQGIKDGSIVTSKWIRMVFEIIVEGIESKRWQFDQKKANHAIQFIESKCHHSEGELAPQKLKLELWQKAIVSAIFGIIGKDGYRQFREVMIVVGRKNGKTLFASAIMEYMIFSDDEYGAKAFCLAPKVEQADIVYSAFWQSVQLEPELKAKTKHRKSDIYVSETNSSVKKIAFNASKSDGFNPLMVCADEISSWSGDKGLKQWEVMKSGMGSRRQPLMLAITTSGYQNDSIYDELVKRSTRFLLGESKERRLLPFLYMIDDVEKWNDINELRKSNPNLGVSVSVDYLLEEIAIAEGSLSKKVEFITKYCCLKQNSSTAWLSTQTVQKCMGDELRLEDFSHTYCVGGLDLSQTTDLTSACVIIEKNGILNVISKCWLPAERIDEASERDGVPYRLYIERGLLAPSGDNYVDYKDCYNWFVDLVERYNILPLMIGYDRYSAQYLIQDLKAYGFRCDDVYQGDNLWGVMQEAEGLMKDGKVCIGDNDITKAHFLNSAVKMSTERGRGKLIKVSPTAHIDSMASLLCGLTVRQKHWPELGMQLKNER
ncbi:MAG: terminase large subunit [Clostridiales bacterium]|nr:terminase large subunit [Clostridiales bacterium]